MKNICLCEIIRYIHPKGSQKEVHEDTQVMQGEGAPTVRILKTWDAEFKPGREREMIAWRLMLSISLDNADMYVSVTWNLPQKLLTSNFLPNHWDLKCTCMGQKLCNLSTTIFSHKLINHPNFTIFMFLHKIHKCKHCQLPRSSHVYFQELARPWFFLFFFTSPNFQGF